MTAAGGVVKWPRATADDASTTRTDASATTTDASTTRTDASATTTDASRREPTLPRREPTLPRREPTHTARSARSRRGRALAHLRAADLRPLHQPHHRPQRRDRPPGIEAPVRFPPGAARPSTPWSTSAPSGPTSSSPPPTSTTPAWSLPTPRRVILGSNECASGGRHLHPREVDLRAGPGRGVPAAHLGCVRLADGLHPGADPERFRRDPVPYVRGFAGRGRTHPGVSHRGAAGGSGIPSALSHYHGFRGISAPAW